MQTRELGRKSQEVVHGGHHDETSAPVASWTTARLLLTRARSHNQEHWDRSHQQRHRIIGNRSQPTRQERSQADCLCRRTIKENRVLLKTEKRERIPPTTSPSLLRTEARKIHFGVHHHQRKGILLSSNFLGRTSEHTTNHKEKQSTTQDGKTRENSSNYESTTDGPKELPWRTRNQMQGRYSNISKKKKCEPNTR